MPHAWINGTFVDESQASVSIRDTGLLHAIGVFTTMRAREGSVVRFDAHLARIRDSCETFFIPLQHDAAALKQAAAELLSRNELAEARLRLTVTRGATANDPVHGLRVQPTALLTAAPFEPYPNEYYERGLTVVALDEQKLNPYDVQAGHKTLNYMSRMHALRDANQRGAGEALWFNVHNYLQSGSVSNVFLVKDGVLLTPPTQADLRDDDVKSRTPYPHSNVLPGTARGAIIELAKSEGVEVRIGALTIHDLLAADEVFVSNSAMGVMPVCRIERKAIANDKPGPLTRRLGSQLP
jgi:branched-chain amino acid aminotransferase